MFLRASHYETDFGYSRNNRADEDTAQKREDGSGAEDKAHNNSHAEGNALDDTIQVADRARSNTGLARRPGFAMAGVTPDISHIPALRPGSPRPATGPVRFTLASLPERDRMPIYRDFFGRSVCRFEIDPLDGIAFDVDVMLHSLPGLQLFTGRVQGSRCGRTPALLADGTDGLALVVNLGGPYLASQGGQEFVLGDGEAVLLSEADPFFLSHHPPGGLLVLRVPRARLAPFVRDPEDRRMLRIPRASAPLQLLTSYVRIAWEERTIGSIELQHMAATHIHDLIALAIGASPDTAPVAQCRGLRAARLMAIKDDIAGTLSQCDLSLTSLASRHGLTPRLVQRLFETEGTSFTDYVLSERLARAHRLLGDRRRDGDKISTIAWDCGFGDLSYFNQAFRRRYGLTPSDVRTQAREGQSASKTLPGRSATGAAHKEH